MAKTGKDKLIGAELNRQLDEKRLKVRKGVTQDAFITVDLCPSGKPKGDEAQTRRSRGGNWVKRQKESVFGY